MAMVEDNNTLYNSLAIILAKIVGNEQMKYRIPQQF